MPNKNLKKMLKNLDSGSENMIDFEVDEKVEEVQSPKKLVAV
jgi:hypothetical protein